MLNSAQQVRDAYGSVMQNSTFVEAVDSDTAGIPHTYDRIAAWGILLRATTGINFNVPDLLEDPATGERQIAFNGF